MFQVTTPQGRRIAVRRTEGRGPGVVFLHGFRSDMSGTKAEALAAWAATQGRAFVRFDLSGHGESGGQIDEFGIGDWLEDSLAVLDAMTDGPQVLVGSSLGGWLALLLARDTPGRVAGVVTVAAAPDFTTRLQTALSAADREALARDGVVTRPSAYGVPYAYSARLFAQGAQQTLFGTPLPLPMPVRLLHGTGDAEVPMEDALRLLDHADCPDMRLTLVKDADHRFSAPECLALLCGTVAALG